MCGIDTTTEVTIVEQIFFIWGNNKVEEMSLCINLN